MATIGIHGRNMAEQAKHPESSDALKALARFGFLSKGVVYALLGVLALMAAWGEGGGITDPQGSLKVMGSGPFGAVVVTLVGIGLAGYALWRFVEAIRDPRGVGTDGKGIAKRIGYAASGVVNGALAFTAFQMVFAGRPGRSQESVISQVMSAPFGQFLVGALGVAIVLAAFAQFYQAYKERYMDDLKTGEMSPRQRSWTEKVGKLGLAARGVVFTIIGVAITRAAINHSPGQSKGIGEALKDIGASDWGTGLLTIVALGFVAYAVYMLSCVRFRKLVTP